MEKKHAQLVSKVNKLQSELGEERQLNGLLIKDKELLSRQRDELEKLRMRVCFYSWREKYIFDELEMEY